MEQDLFTLRLPCMPFHALTGEDSPTPPQPQGLPAFPLPFLTVIYQFSEVNQCRGQLASDCFGERKSIGPTFFPGEGELAEMASGFPYLHGYFLLAGNDYGQGFICEADRAKL